MIFAEFHLKRSLIIRAEHNSELIRFIAQIAEESKITAGTFTAIGALKSAKIAFYDQEKHKYRQTTLGAPHEMVCCIGNISLRDGKPFVHAHAVLADEVGSVRAGHLVEGIVFASEICLFELVGPDLERNYDETTGLPLWNIK